MDRLKENVVGKGHRLFARKQAGAGIYNSRRPKLPGLNTRDFAECHVLDDEMVLEETRAFIFSMYKDARTLIETQAHDGDDVVSTPSAAGEGRQRLEWTVGHVARFIVDRKPTQHADGSWVVLCPKTGPSNTVEPAYCVPLDECKEQKAVRLSAVPEASEAAWPPLPPSRRAPAVLEMANTWQWLEQSMAHSECDSEAVSLIDCESVLSLEEDEPEAISIADSVSIVSLADSDVGDVLDLGSARQTNGSDNDAVGEAAQSVLQDMAGTAAATPKPDSLLSGGAWRGAAATRAAVSFDSGEPRTFKAREPTAAQGVPPHVEEEQEGCATAAATLAQSTLADEDEGDGWLDFTAGKDGRHRIRGSHGLSAKAVEKRQNAKAKRVCARGVFV